MCALGQRQTSQCNHQFHFTSKADISRLLAYAASIEQYSEHPIAKGIVKNVKDKWHVENFRAIPGKGAEGIVRGKNVKAVSPGYLHRCWSSCAHQQEEAA